MRIASDTLHTAGNWIEGLALKYWMLPSDFDSWYSGTSEQQQLIV